GEQGFDLAREQTPDLIVLDLMLPRMDGYKVCRALKFDERYRTLPIFILSARSGEEDRRLALEMGADLFITKPYEMKELVSKIRARLQLPPRRAAA
ncbi:MAG: response regulator transcription factor, partial [Candidatus Eiseniibacteriota bacterium]